MNVVNGYIKPILRLEGASILLVSCLAFANSTSSWTLFAVLFLAPDLSLLAYLWGKKIGAIAYNTTHSYFLPVASLSIGIMADNNLMLNIGLIWCAHIGFDRSLGYGLKYASGFKHTHLGTIGR
jgi:hypothetical protein